jgi:hypothetical protein
MLASPRRPRPADAPDEGVAMVETLGPEVVESLVLARLDARSLACISACCKAFRSFGPSGRSSLRLAERVARRAVLEANRGSLEEACRWRCALPAACMATGVRLAAGEPHRPWAVALAKTAPSRRCRRCCGASAARACLLHAVTGPKTLLREHVPQQHCTGPEPSVALSTRGASTRIHHSCGGTCTSQGPSLLAPAPTPTPPPPMRPF